MTKNLRYLSVLWLIFSSFAVASDQQSQPKIQNLDHGQLTFVYQENLSPWDSYKCKHEQDGPVDWKVYCKLDTKVVEFGVHLLVNRYTKTRYGFGAYEVLYWVTDRTEPRSRTFDSTTMWIHNSSNENNVNRFQLSQGIINDLASLRLTIIL